MNPLNNITFEGNVVRDSAVKSLGEGKGNVGKMTVAVDRSFKNSAGELVKDVSYFDVEGYGKIADVIAEKGKKGQFVRIEGELKQDRWKDKDGKNQASIKVVASSVGVKAPERNMGTPTRPVNLAVVEGNLVKDASYKSLGEGRAAVTSFTLASNKTFKNSKGEFETEVSYFDVDAYGKLADVMKEKGTKGKGMRIEGHLQQDTWKDKEGKTHSSTKIVASTLSFMMNQEKKVEKAAPAKETKKDEPELGR